MRIGKGVAVAGLVAFAWLAPPARAGELLVGNKSADSVWRLSTANGRKLGEFVTGRGPHEIAVAPDGSFAVVANYGGPQPGNTLTRLPLRSHDAPRTIDLGPHGRPHGMRFLPGDPDVLLVTSEASNALLRVDVGTGDVVRTYEIGTGLGHMVAVAPTGRVAYVAKISAGTIVRVDLDSGEVLERPAGAGAEGIATRPGSDEVWVANREAGTVTVHDGATLAVRHTFRSPGFPIRIAFTADGRQALVVNAKAATLGVYDARRRVQVATVALARAGHDYQPTLLGQAALPIGVAVDPSRPRAYVAIAGGDEVAVIDLERHRLVDRLPTGREPDALAIVP